MKKKENEYGNVYSHLPGIIIMKLSCGSGKYDLFEYVIAHEYTKKYVLKLI